MQRARKKTVFTVGYQGRTQADFIATLTKAGIELVIDVRELPLSRKKGFSKTGLAEALKQAGIEYRHIRAAGNPFRKQAANIRRCLGLYQRHLEKQGDMLAEVERAADHQRTALLCMESDPDMCHRSVLARALPHQHAVVHL